MEPTLLAMNVMSLPGGQLDVAPHALQCSSMVLFFLLAALSTTSVPGSPHAEHSTKAPMKCARLAWSSDEVYQPPSSTPPLGSVLQRVDDASARCLPKCAGSRRSDLAIGPRLWMAVHLPCVPCPVHVLSMAGILYR